MTLLALMLSVVGLGVAQDFRERYPLASSGQYEIENPNGRIRVEVATKEDSEPSVTASSIKRFARSKITIGSAKGKVRIEVAPTSGDDRIDLVVSVPERSVLRLVSKEGEISFSGDFKEVSAETTTGSVIADLPLENLKYKLLWTASRPRLVSQKELSEPDERNAGKFVVEGELKEPSADGPRDRTDLEVRTARGIVLLNVDPSEVPSNLTERPLTEAAKAMIRGGDILLTEAIRRASPKYFGDYASTLPPRRASPELLAASKRPAVSPAAIRKVNVQVTDENNRAIAGLMEKDFVLTENGREREIISVETSSASFNLVLLLDVSGSVVSYVDFIRKAARSFVNTVDRNDKVAIVIFNDDVKTLSAFTTDRGRLSESLDTFDAGGGTAYYDALGYILSDTLSALSGEPSAIVALTDGEDNRSFLSFNSLLGSIQESGALVYPLYVPAGVISRAAAAEKYGTRDQGSVPDPLRDKYLFEQLTEKAAEEGEMLARISGGVYYPISRLSELQNAYDDIVRQLRTSYTVTYRSDPTAADAGTFPRIRVKVKREGTFVRVASELPPGS